MQTLPLLWLSLAFLAGILLAGQVVLPAWAWLALSGAALVAGVLLRRWRNMAIHLALLPLAVCLGAARFQAAQPKMDPFFIAWYNDRDYEVWVTGELVEPPAVRDTYTNLTLRVVNIDTSNISPLPAHGLILARVPNSEAYVYGDRLRLRGYVVTPPENEEFSYRDYLAMHGIHSVMTGAEVTRLPGRGGNPLLRGLYAFKDRALRTIYRLYPDPEAPLLAGILLGVESGLPARLQQAFKNTGTAHIIAISGFNIAIIAGLFVSSFGRLLGERRGALAAILGVTLYTVLVGADAAVVRAAVMGSLSILGRQAGRRQHGLNSLAFVAALMAVFDPFVLRDVGFQLSFGATLGLILYGGPLEAWATRMAGRRFPAERAKIIAGLIGENVLLTLAAQLTTLPIMAYHFRRISLVSLVANPFILPVQPAVMLAGGLALLLGLVWLPLGQLAAWAAWPFVAYTIRVVEWFDRLPHGVVVLGEMSLLFVILFYVVLFALTFFPERVRPLLRPSVALTGLALAALVVWRLALGAPDGRLHLTFLDVGSADAILIQTPDGRVLLIGGGPSPALLADGLGRRLPPVRRQLDWLVVASTQEAQLAALPRVLENYPAAQVLWAGRRDASYASRRLDERLTETSIPVRFARPGDRLDLGRGARLQALTVGARGMVLLLEWGGFRALLPVGMSFSDLDTLERGRAIGPVSVLLLAESGYAPANPPEWIEALNPQLVVISVAPGDRFGLPDDATLEALTGYGLLRTDQDGWVHVSTDGKRMWVEAGR